MEGMMSFDLGRWLKLSAIAATLLVAAVPAHAGQLLKVLYSFCQLSGCADGSHPSGALVMDTDKNLFGTTINGGRSNGGTVFEITFNPDTGARRFKSIYNFCNINPCQDGGNPVDGTLILGTDGSLYGTASTGGIANGGVVYRLTPDKHKRNWTYTALYNFCVNSSVCNDGEAPIGGLTYATAATGGLYDGIAPLYGITSAGGSKHFGMTFSLTPGAGDWQQKIIYDFCIAGHDACLDGKIPNGGLAMDESGNLAGTTSQGGATNSGIVFRLTPSGKPRWTQTVLHDFCTTDGCPDGQSPNKGVVVDAYGNIYGTTPAGGNADDICGANGCGVAFKVDPNGVETQLYTFCSQNKCHDGGVPSQIALDPFGNLIGMTSVSGKQKGGTLYLLNGLLTVTRTFKCKETACPAGNLPDGAPIADRDGNVFGTMSTGGKNNAGGSVFESPAPTQ
jgi:uncharacterized repeat protein (TIGR03803 family)